MLQRVGCDADRQLLGYAPVPPLIPRLLYADATPEALAHALATGWPSGGVLSAEAGAVFGARIRELLAQPLATDAHGCLTPAVLDLSPQARAEWIRFHDEIELGARGAFRGVRDVAAKAAENAARLAALFHVLEHGASGTITSEEIRAAACIVGWHLNEARRPLADLDTPASLAAAIRLDSWLRNEAIANDTDRVPTKRIYQYGPNCVRDSRDLRAALAILAERGRARMEEDGRRRSVAINPALLDGRE